MATPKPRKPKARPTLSNNQWQALQCLADGWKSRNINKNTLRALVGRGLLEYSEAWGNHRLTEEALKHITPKTFLTYNQCPRHGCRSVSIDTAYRGRRLTPSKCCGSWLPKQKWEMPVERLLDDLLQFDPKTVKAWIEGQE